MATVEYHRQRAAMLIRLADVTLDSETAASLVRLAAEHTTLAEQGARQQIKAREVQWSKTKPRPWGEALGESIRPRVMLKLCSHEFARRRPAHRPCSRPPAGQTLQSASRELLRNMRTRPVGASDNDSTPPRGREASRRAHAPAHLDRAGTNSQGGCARPPD